MNYKMPHTKAPCGLCPFRKGTKIVLSRLYATKAQEILDVDNFVCHKKPTLQCCGHLHLADKNEYRSIAKTLDIDLGLKTERLFDTQKDFLNHHNNNNERRKER